MIVLSSLELTYNNYIKHINSGQEEGGINIQFIVFGSSKLRQGVWM